MANIKLKVAYDGTHYLGWQKTKMGPSIEEILENVLSQILQEELALQAASRTDAGVHAKGQIVNFIATKEIPSLQRLLVSLNCLLPKDIAVLDIEQAADDFHPTLDCISKEYHYWVCYGTAQLPHHRFYSWHYPHQLNIDAMQRTAKQLVGEHDFSTFCNFKKNSSYDHTIRRVQEITVTELPEQRVHFRIVGNNFLYKMVRNLVGTLVYVGRGKIQEESIPGILLSGDRTQAGVTAPAHGLCLHHVFYKSSKFTG